MDDSAAQVPDASGDDKASGADAHYELAALLRDRSRDCIKCACSSEIVYMYVF